MEFNTKRRNDKMASAFVLFGRAFKNAKKDFWVSIQVLFWITIVLAILYWWEEGKAQPDIYGGISGLFQSFAWAVTRYIGDPGHFASDSPVTLTGRYVDTAIGILKILIFAVPAGLVANGFSKAMGDEKRRVYMENIRQRIRKSFRRVHHASFEKYLDSHPEFGQDKSSFARFFFTPEKVSIAKLETRGLKFGDIIDAINEFPEFRLKNMATAISPENQPEDRLVVEHIPINTEYGCLIDRNSNITIVATSSYAEVGAGWFAYYMAKLGGFNLICKDIDVDVDEPESFYAMPAEIKVNDMTEKDMRKDEKKYKKELEIVKKKSKRRELFIEDLKNLCTGENKWCVMLLSHIKNKDNTIDLHFAHCKKDGSASTVYDMEAYQRMLGEMQEKLQEDFHLVAEETTVYPLKPSNLGYKLKKRKCEVNAFTIRISTDVICFDSRTLSIIYRMASVMNEHFKGHGMTHEDKKDFKERTFGYTELDTYKSQNIKQ